MSGYYSELIKWYLWFVSTMMIILTALFVYRNGQESTFQQQASTIISQNGGVNSQDRDKLNQLSSNYHNRFTIESNDSNPASFGDSIEYKIHTNVKYIYSLAYKNTKSAYIGSTYGK